MAYFESNSDNAKWKYLDEVTGGTAIALPSDAFNELYVNVSVDNNNNLNHVITIPFDLIPPVGSPRGFRMGWYMNSTANGAFQVTVERTNITLTVAFWNGADYKSTSKLIVYYR